MRKRSTGEPSNLEIYRNIAIALTGNKNSKAVKFFDKKIKESPNKEKEVIHLILTLIKEELDDILQT